MKKLSLDEAAENASFYARYWRQMLGCCLGWDKAKVEDFCDRMIKPPFVILHEKAGFWIAEAFIPADAVKALDEEANSRVVTEVIELIDPDDLDYETFQLNEDLCRNLKARIAKLVTSSA